MRKLSGSLTKKNEWLYSFAQAMLRSFLVLIVVFFTYSSLFAQEFFPKTNYPGTVFKEPLNIPTSLAGNYGECRPNHFHSGIDVRTEQKENLPIHSIQDGYVSRISISHKGFGNCLFINHPGGFTSVYAHCNVFFPSLWAYLTKKQYEQKKWDVDIQIPPHLFPVTKGMYVAKSGNTGSSHAPHLHMEIRDTKTDKTLNGLLFYTKMADLKKPIINRVAVYDGQKSIYEQEPQIFRAIAKGGYDVPSTELIKINSDKVYFGIEANDFMENSLRLGIYQMKLSVDGKAVFGWQLNNIGYDETRYMNAIGDYKTKMSKGFWLQLCRRLPNDQLNVYINKDGKDGLVDVGDGAVHSIVISVFDVKGNQKDIKFQVQGILKGQKIQASNCSNLLKNGHANELVLGNVGIKMSKTELYDDVCFRANSLPSTQPYSYIYQVHSAHVPVHDYFTLTLKPKQAVGQENATKVALRYSPNDDMTEAVGMAAEWQNGKVVAQVRNFGNYEIVLDQTPPSIAASVSNGMKVSNGTRLKFSAEDEITSVKKVEVLVGDKWLCFGRRKNSYYYTVDSHFPVGKNTLRIRAWDENNNMQEKVFSIVK